VDVLFAGKLLAEETVAEMSAEVRRNAGYGLGVQILDLAGYRALGHTGGVEGYLGAAFCMPEAGLCLAVMSNDWRGGDLWGLAETLIGIAAGPEQG
jgi:hypothetical protein